MQDSGWILHTQTHTHPDLLDIFFCPDVRRVDQGAHDLQVAMDDEGLIGAVSVDTDSTVMVHGVWQLPTLPQHLVVTFKLAWVGCLTHRTKEERWTENLDSDIKTFRPKYKIKTTV